MKKGIVKKKVAKPGVKPGRTIRVYDVCADAVAAEREACAVLVEGLTQLVIDTPLNDIPAAIAKAIRARGK